MLCGYFIKESSCFAKIKLSGYIFNDSTIFNDDGMPLKHYRKEILQNTSKKDSFTVRFHLGVRKTSEVRFGSVRGIEREKEGVNLDSITYEGLIVDVKSFGFRFKRMWYEMMDMKIEIKGDGDVNNILYWECGGKFIIHLYVEGGVDSEWEGEYDEEMMKMLREEWRMKHDVYSELGRANAECFEATTSIAEEDLDYVKKQVELHGKPKDEETITLEHYVEEIFLNTLNEGKRQRDDDHAQPRHNKELNFELNLWSPYQVESTGATQGKRQKEDDQAHPNHSLELKLELNSGPTPQVESTSATQGKRQREDDDAHPQINEELNLELNLWPTE